MRSGAYGLSAHLSVKVLLQIIWRGENRGGGRGLYVCVCVCGSDIKRHQAAMSSLGPPAPQQGERRTESHLGTDRLAASRRPSRVPPLHSLLPSSLLPQSSR